MNDPDCLLVRRDKSSLSLPEVQTLVSVMSLSGGMLLLSDDLRVLPGEREQLVRQTLPPSGVAARALGLFTTEKPQRFVYTGSDRSGTLTALGALVNWHDGPRELTVSAAAFELPDGEYHAFELWTKRYKRLKPGELVPLRIAPHGTALWLLRAATDHPQVVSLSHHLWQTLLLLEQESWDDDRRVLTISLSPKTAGDGELRIVVPSGFRFVKVDATIGSITVNGQSSFGDGTTLHCKLERSDTPAVVSALFEPLDCI